ncbi:hypothetical protein H257_04952 [Aphanomyces astaci]|uniref:DDE Tnp4 domain-containing protein n=1 Tax=Aphanomyces astaci TaxID=112090 RepID=W4GRC7_APHAT|nr:hypothetical protein H257_04952 [Aphanomyces astaci]ETV82252.1 hypothetical protein H257_04952 [Aphanomyces astaci]|eukprot:XP_009827921.1 hypothetical protein H257_04952 [Aphanomyces astaci]
MNTGGSWDIVATIFMEASPIFQKQVMNFVKVFHAFVIRKYVNAQLSVLPNGFAIDCTKHYKGSVSDKTIFDENLHFHMASLTKQASEDRMDDPDQATRQWAIKKPTGGILTADGIRTSDRIATDRNYDILFETYVAMMNVHIRMRPLRVDDGDVNVQYVNELNAIETKTVKGKKSSARTYRSKRKARLSLIMAVESSMAAGDAGGSDTNLGSNSENESSSRLFI